MAISREREKSGAMEVRTDNATTICQCRREVECQHCLQPQSIRQKCNAMAPRWKEKERPSLKSDQQRNDKLILFHDNHNSQFLWPDKLEEKRKERRPMFQIHGSVTLGLFYCKLFSINNSTPCMREKILHQINCKFGPNNNHRKSLEKGEGNH